MSRIGNKIIEIPAGVSVTLEGDKIVVKGPKGTLDVKALAHIDTHIEDGKVTFTRHDETSAAKTNHGTQRALVANAVQGVAHGFKKELEIVGIGYRAMMRGDNLVLNVGYSHEVVIVPEPGVKISCPSQTEVHVEGIDKRAVGETAARIKLTRRPEPYNGKGIKFKGEHIIRKEGKRAGKK